MRKLQTEYTLEIPAHPSIYEPKERNLKITYTIPKTGIDTKTGILFFVNGYGADMENLYYKKFRKQIADKDNMIVIQTKYFGHEFMGDIKEIKDIEFLDNKISKNKIHEIISKSNSLNEIIMKSSHLSKKFIIKSKMDEDKTNFNDMSLMQAIDVLTAFYALKIILKENNIEFNNNKKILFGTSHGAYISLLVNALTQGKVFDLVIDNGSYITPAYAHNNRRYVYGNVNGSLLMKEFDYMINKIKIDKEIIDLRKVYKQIKNENIIISINGQKDNFTKIEEKFDFVKYNNNHFLYPITENKVNSVFKSEKHADSELYKLYFWVIKLFNLDNNSKNEQFSEINTSYAKYKITIENGFPKLNISNDVMKIYN